MAIELEFINLIIPIEKINKYYPGGFYKYLEDHKERIGMTVWFDNYLVRDGAMNPIDIKLLIAKWEELGLKSKTRKKGIEQWKDLCVVDSFRGTTLPCDWLIKKDNIALHKKDKTEIVINRSNVLKICY